ncbi:DUF4931 domain-containing protein [Peptostreptococcus porci]|uniref:galactose-1-phosphate uridylyltransferase n=1 Tax=Peptostreptococcus porci TaxID=2652282 RepID=UPI002A81B7FB|nr:DUF4931 domain-containing protein [Peptostreptococcus porci]MDY4129610.1 DUF4931 domain-containing protein [Peptostreptococcus porci]
MKEIRKDVMTGDISIYSTTRNNRPHDKVKINATFEATGEEYVDNCPFCRGNESWCGVPKGEIIKNGKWVARSVGNKFPIVDMTTKDIFGQHEVLIETHRHNGSFYNMSDEELCDFFNLLVSRYKELKTMDDIKYVNIFKNSQKNSGASLLHPHTQIISLNIIPPEVQKELDIAEDYYAKNKESLYDNIVNEELEYENRVVFDGKYFIVFVPYATRYSGEIRIVQKDKTNFDKLSGVYIDELSFIIGNLFGKWGEYQGEIPFNMIIHTCPVGEKYRDIYRTHFHIIPRIYNFGGFELSTNIFVCSSDTDELAKELRFNFKK